ncbi:hypothetical protein KSP40_PGU017545 [Platanthera guangdongensis]|uniref:Uncharacterized protein n=1 Tax=Platanthera guangdongensis TaxID=2320717 RepID=A0ABR2M2X0_9ASPA
MEGRLAGEDEEEVGAKRIGRDAGSVRRATAKMGKKDKSTSKLDSQIGEAVEGKLRKGHMKDLILICCNAREGCLGDKPRLRLFWNEGLEVCSWERKLRGEDAIWVEIGKGIVDEVGNGTATG